MEEGLLFFPCSDILYLQIQVNEFIILLFFFVFCLCVSVFSFSASRLLPDSLLIWNRLLDPNLESSGSLFVGSYILQLILHLPSQMAVHIRDLVAALVRRMQSAQIASLRSSLLVVFARLVILI